MEHQGRIQFKRDSDLDGLEVGLACDVCHEFPQHTHDFYVIGVMDGGVSYCLKTNGAGGQVSAGELALINPGQVHTGGARNDNRISYRIFYVPVDWMRQACAEIRDGDDSIPEFHQLVAGSAEAAWRLRTLETLVGGPSGPLRKQALMLSTFSGLLGAFGEVKPKTIQWGSHRAVRLAREYLHAHYDRRVSLQELADNVGISRYHLLRVFKQVMGLPPHAYQVQIRIGRACSLLRSGCGIADVALDVGFADQSHFTNTFRRNLGVPPGQYAAG